MKISALADCPHLSPVIAQWHFGEWGHLYPGGTVDGWLHHIRTRMNADRIPTTVPWLGGVYVIPPARRSGVARALVRHVMARAADFRIRDLYLYTNGAEGLYQKLTGECYHASRTWAGKSRS